MKTRSANAVINDLAATQHGVVTRAQLLAAGASAAQIHRRVCSRSLRPLHRGVYVVGPLTVPLALPMSAILSCGPSAVLSHRSAAALWHLMESSDSQVVDVIIARNDRHRRPGIRTHHCELHADEVTRHENIPVTTPTRTLLDLAHGISGRDLERVVAEALSLRLTSESVITKLAKRYERRPASARLLQLIGPSHEPALTRSAAEEALLALITKAKLPRPSLNARVVGHEVDFYWRAERLIVEIDGYAFHGSRVRFESDRRRDAALLAAGLRVMRVTWQQIEREPEALLVRIAQALAPRV